MPVAFRIFPKYQMILFSYAGRVSLQETMDAVAASTCHPDHRPGLRHFCDVSQVTSVESDFPKLLKMQARIAEAFQPEADDPLVLFYAPTRVGQKMARMAQKSWHGLGAVIVVICDEEAEALAVLGLKALSLALLMQEAI